MYIRDGVFKVGCQLLNPLPWQVIFCKITRKLKKCDKFLDLIQQLIDVLNFIIGRNQGIMNGESSVDDPLFITTRLLSDALTRLRIFVFGLDPMQWLSLRDRNCLYTSQICCLAILKSSVAIGKILS